MIWSVLAIFSWRLESCWWKKLASKQFLQENQWWWWFKNHFPSSAARAAQTCSLDVVVVVVVGLSVCLSLWEETNFVLGFVLGESKQQVHFMEKEKINQFMVSWRTQEEVQSNRPWKFACLLVVRNHEICCWWHGNCRLAAGRHSNNSSLLSLRATRKWFQYPRSTMRVAAMKMLMMSIMIIMCGTVVEEQEQELQLWRLWSVWPRMALLIAVAGRLTKEPLADSEPISSSLVIRKQPTIA